MMVVRWLVTWVRDAEDVQVFPYEDEADARAMYDRLNTQWTGIRLCRVLRSGELAHDEQPEVLDAPAPLETDQGSRVLPGEWLCRTCGFKLSTRTLNPTNGATGVDARLTRHECPNDGALMVQATEADVIEALNECVESWIDAYNDGGGRWWHVTDQLPPPDLRVVVFRAGQVDFGRWRRILSHADRAPVCGWQVDGAVGPMVTDVTHWRNLPKAPGA